MHPPANRITKSSKVNREIVKRVLPLYTVLLTRLSFGGKLIAHLRIGGGGATLGVARMAAAEHRLRSAAPPQAAEPSSGGMAAHNRRLVDIWRFVRTNDLTPLPTVPAPVEKTSVGANVAAAARMAARPRAHAVRAAEQQQLPSRGVADFLDGTGLRCEHRVDPPPEDASHLFEFWGAGGNSGVSGQRIVHDAPPAPASKL